MWQWLITTGVVKALVYTVTKQGFSILLLIVGVGVTGWMYYTERADRHKDQMQLRQEIQACQNQILEYYRQDRRQSDLIIQRATDVMERLEKLLEK